VINWDITGKIEKDLDESISELKKLKQMIPTNLYNLTSRDEFIIKKVLAIIEGMNVPIKIEADA